MRYGKYGPRTNKSNMRFSPRVNTICCLTEDGGGSKSARSEANGRIRTIEKREWKEYEEMANDDIETSENNIIDIDSEIHYWGEDLTEYEYKNIVSNGVIWEALVPKKPVVKPKKKRGSKMVSPNACSVCNRDKENHFTRNSDTVGMHTWVEPSNELRKERLQSNRGNRIAHALAQFLVDHEYSIDIDSDYGLEEFRKFIVRYKRVGIRTAEDIAFFNRLAIAYNAGYEFTGKRDYQHHGYETRFNKEFFKRIKANDA